MENLKAGVAAGSLTVRRLAREIGVSQPHMQNIMSGKRALTMQMADRLLQYQHRSALDLASASELGRLSGWLRRSQTPCDTFPSSKECSGPLTHSLNSEGRRLEASSAARRLSHHPPVFAELGSDAELARDFPGAKFALMDLSSHSRTNISQQRWYAIRWSGGGWIRRLRLEPGKLLVLGQGALRLPWGRTGLT